MSRVVLFLVILAPCVLARNDIIKRQKALSSCLSEPSTTDLTRSITRNDCTKKCISEKLGLIDSSGNPIESNYDAIERQFVRDCDRDTRQDDPCSRANAFEVCLDGKREKHEELLKRQCREENNYEDYGNSSEVACFHKCLAVKNGVLTEDGEIVGAAMRMFTGEDGDFEESMEKCKQEYEHVTGCENVISVLQCVIENSTAQEE